MSKAQATRANIIRQGAVLFNQKGYAASSMADIMQATGLQKGGIYNHFQSKEELSLYGVKQISRQVWQAAIAQLSSY